MCSFYRTRQGDGLLVYMDDGGYYDFLEMKLVKGELHVRYWKRFVLCIKRTVSLDGFGFF
jgi:hypothetical protein